MNGLRVEAGVSAYYLRRQRRERVRRIRRAVLLIGAGFAVALIAVVLAYAGSADKVAGGVRVAGVEVSGLTSQAAERLLQRRSAALLATPLKVTVAGHTFSVTAGELGVRPDWHAAVEAALSRGSGFLPLRGVRRLYLSMFGTDVSPHVNVAKNALGLWLDRVSGQVDRPHRDAALRLRGLRPHIVPGRAGTVLDRAAAEKLVVAELGSFDRKPLTLLVKTDPPSVTEPMLARAARQTRVVLSGPVRLQLGSTRYRVSRFTLAHVIQLPSSGASTLKIAGPAADAYFGRLEKAVDSPGKDATFAVDGAHVRIVPSQDARILDVPATARALLAAAISPTNRTAQISVAATAPERTTRDLQGMGVVGLVSSYETFFGGVAGRIHNVQLVAHLIDGHLIQPGEEFSFNKTTGDRTASRGFQVAPVIINGELQNALGGGVCQVSTTVFNAAYEAGLNITARTNHALYISHYPQGRDATVDYPDVDLRFVNDTDHWLLLRTFVTDSSLVVNLYGTPVHRKVVSETAPLVTTGPGPVKRMPDPNLLVGQQVIDQTGSSASATSVHRQVYAANGKLLYDNVWYSSYRGETEVIRVGTKPKPKPVAPVVPPVIPAPGSLH